jgi:beta-lactam-binding protein with PASTA domain/tRNA A-37 threonylcarbamoyl transferase component Bud32
VSGTLPPTGPNGPDSTPTQGNQAGSTGSRPRLLGGRYEVGELLGRGGMADVRRGYDTRLNRTVAIKTLRADLASDPTLHSRFRREAQNAARLNDPSIVAVYDTGEEEWGNELVPYIVMEFVPGRTLRDVLREGRAILPERALEITSDVLRALSYSHAAGIVHRDIKPGNVMLTPTGDVKVMDFGIARAIADTHATMTATAAVMGTAQYLSPEQARGEKVDARSDLYSTSCLLYELLTGRPPFVGDSPVAVAYQHVREAPSAPSTRKHDLPANIDTVVLRGLAKDPDDRYQTADDFRADVDRAMAGEAVTAITPPVVSDPAAERAAAATGVIPGFAEPGENPFAPDQEEPSHRGRRAAMVTMLVVGILAIFVLGAWGLQHYFNNRAGVNQQAVPKVVGLQQSQAENALRSAGLKFTITHANSQTVAKGVVISQQPDPDTLVDPAVANVGVTVSDGKDQVTIPVVIGKDINDADGLLADLGLRVKRSVDKNANGALNTVVRVDPGEGVTVDKGSSVRLYYATGDVTVPDVVGLDQTAAEAKLQALKLDPDVIEQASDKPTGTVISQEPRKDERVASGSKVIIVVAKAMPPPPPKPTPTPTPEVTPTPTPTPTAGPGKGGGIGDGGGAGKNLLPR